MFDFAVRAALIGAVIAFVIGYKLWRSGPRAKHLMLGSLFATISIGLLLAIAALTHESYLLARDGQQSVGTVVDSDERRIGRRRSTLVNRYAVEYGKGHRRWFDSDESISVGTRVPVVFLPEDPDVARLTSKPVTVWGEIRKVSVFFFGFIVFSAAFCAWRSMKMFRIATVDNGVRGLSNA